MGYIKGQRLRLMIAKGVTTKCIAAATSCSIETSANVEEVTTKDSTGDWAENEVNGLSWTASSEMLVIDTKDDDANDLKDLYDAYVTKKPVAIAVNITKGDKNRTVDTDAILAMTGNAIITNLSITGQNKQNVTATIQLTGTGELSME